MRYWPQTNSWSIKSYFYYFIIASVHDWIFTCLCLVSFVFWCLLVVWFCVCTCFFHFLHMCVCVCGHNGTIVAMHTLARLVWLVLFGECTSRLETPKLHRSLGECAWDVRNAAHSFPECQLCNHFVLHQMQCNYWFIAFLSPIQNHKFNIKNHLKSKAYRIWRHCKRLFEWLPLRTFGINATISYADIKPFLRGVKRKYGTI